MLQICQKVFQIVSKCPRLSKNVPECPEMSQLSNSDASLSERTCFSIIEKNENQILTPLLLQKHFFFLFEKLSSEQELLEFLVACKRLYSSLCLSVGRSIGRSVGNHFTFFMIFGHNCSWPITRDCSVVYTNLFSKSNSSLPC